MLFWSIFFFQIPYFQIRENNWTLNADMNGRWNVKYDLWRRKTHFAWGSICKKKSYNYNSLAGTVMVWILNPELALAYLFSYPRCLCHPLWRVHLSPKFLFCMPFRLSCTLEIFHLSGNNWKYPILINIYYGHKFLALERSHCINRVNICQSRVKSGAALGEGLDLCRVGLGLVWIS